MLRVSLRLLLVAAHLPLLCAEPSHTEEPSSPSGRDKVKPVSCGKDCEDTARGRKKRTPAAKCELYYYVPTAKNETFFFWNNSKTELREAYDKIASFLQENSHRPILFPAHLPLVENHNGSEVLVLLDVYVRAQGTCGQLAHGESGYGYFETNPDWSKDPGRKLQTELEMLENYMERVPRSHFGFRVPKAGEVDVCLDETGLVVKDFPDIRTCFSMWIFDDRDGKPKHFAGRQIYNRINQDAHVNISEIRFDPSGGGSLVSTESFSLAALFLKEMCHVTNASLENRCTYWTTDQFYVSLCCCYTNRTECAYRSYKFPAEKKPDDPVIRACATGEYYVMKSFGGNHEPKNASDIASSVKQFVRDRTTSEICKWTYTWDPRNETDPEDVLRVALEAEKQKTTITPRLRRCSSDPDKACCRRTPILCPLDLNSNNNATVVECFCSDGDLCNKRRSYLDTNLAEKFKMARPCEVDTVHEHLLWHTDTYKKPSTNLTQGYMCPLFYNFAQPGRPNTFLQLVDGNNFDFDDADQNNTLFQEAGCRLVELYITEEVNCTEKLFGEYDLTSGDLLLVLICSVEGNPLGEKRTSYPDAELKKTIGANLTAAKETFPTCKNGSWSLDFPSLSELVLDNSKLERLYDDMKNGTNDDITTAHCYVEVSFVYQQQYNFTFGAVSIDNKPLHGSCHESEEAETCVQWDSAEDDEHQHFVCCCRRHWSNDTCREVLLDQLKPLMNENVIANKPEDIMSELKSDPLTKCIEAGTPHDGGTDINRPCERNEGCYTGVHARDVQTNKQHKEFGGCVAEDAPDAKKRDDTTTAEVEARFYRICRLQRNEGLCFAVLGTEDTELPNDVKGPQMVCCCDGRVEAAQKCSSSHKFGAKISDLV